MGIHEIIKQQNQIHIMKPTSLAYWYMEEIKYHEIYYPQKNFFFQKSSSICKNYMKYNTMKFITHLFFRNLLNFIHSEFLCVYSSYLVHKCWFSTFIVLYMCLITALIDEAAYDSRVRQYRVMTITSDLLITTHQ